MSERQPGAVRLITWNVARRVTRHAEQAAALAARAPDVVGLQEVTPRTWPLWEAALADAGLAHAAWSTAPPRRTGVLLAARAELRPAEPLPVPWPETAVAREVDGVVFHTVHVPNAANGWIKIETLEAVRAGLERSSGPRVLCGDLNTPRRETPDGTVLSFARDTKGRLRAERGERWDDGELGVVPGLAQLGFADALRSLHGYAKPERSWTFANGKGGWRLDHVFASAELEVVAAGYHHDWRAAGLSDHAPLEADLRRRPARGAPAPPRA
jgi:exodeoxyribonuclease III